MINDPYGYLMVLIAIVLYVIISGTIFGILKHFNPRPSPLGDNHTFAMFWWVSIPFAIVFTLSRFIWDVTSELSLSVCESIEERRKK